MSPETEKRLEAARDRRRKALAELAAAPEIAILKEEAYVADLQLRRDTLTDAEREEIMERAERIFDSKFELGPKPTKPHKGGDAS
jgi:hypothetical protein